MHLLDFEQPIVELEQKLEELRRLNLENAEVDLSENIRLQEQRVEELRASIYQNLTRWQRVQIARHPERPYTLDYIDALTEDFVELHGDRYFGDDKAMIAGIGLFQGSRYGGQDQTVVIVGQQKGRDTKSRKLRRFGMPNPEGYRKALRVMKLAAKFDKPIIALLDTPGAYPGLEAEERGQAEAIARNLFEMARLPVPVIIVVIGEGASGGALGIGVGDHVMMLENTWYSVIAPESCSTILWGSWEYKEQAARALKLTPKDLVGLKIIDEIVPEPLGGAHRDPAQTYENLGQALVPVLQTLGDVDGDTLIDRRLDKFSQMGAWTTLSEAPSEPETVDEQAES